MKPPPTPPTQPAPQKKVKGKTWIRLWSRENVQGTRKRKRPGQRALLSSLPYQDRGMVPSRCLWDPKTEKTKGVTLRPGHRGPPGHICEGAGAPAQPTNMGAGGSEKAVPRLPRQRVAVSIHAAFTGVNTHCWCCSV